MKKVLSIAGSDCSGGAGIQADLKTFSAFKVYGMTVITALTAQNTMGVQQISEVTPDFVAAQLDSVLTDIMPDAVKIGMVSGAATLTVIAEKLRQYRISNIVVDPVMVSTSGSRLMQQEAVEVLKETLLPVADVITPNIPEAEVLSGNRIESAADMFAAAQQLGQETGTAVLLKGGHFTDAADDLLYRENRPRWYRQERVENDNCHGTGCTLSSAIAANLAMGYDLEESVRISKEYITGALRSGLNLGNGSGPLNHFFG